MWINGCDVGNEERGRGGQYCGTDCSTGATGTMGAISAAGAEGFTRALISPDRRPCKPTLLWLSGKRRGTKSLPAAPIRDTDLAARRLSFLNGRG